MRCAVLAIMALGIATGCSEQPDAQAPVVSDPVTRMNEYFVYEQSLGFLQHYRSQTEMLYNSSIGNCDLNETSVAAKRALLAKLIGLAASNARKDDIESLQQLATNQVNDCTEINLIATQLSEHAEAAEQQWREVEGPKIANTQSATEVANAMIAGSERIINTFSQLDQFTGNDEFIATARVASTQALLEYLDTDTPDSLGAWLTKEQEPVRKQLALSVDNAMKAYTAGDIERGDQALRQIKEPLSQLVATN